MSKPFDILTAAKSVCAKVEGREVCIKWVEEKPNQKPAIVTTQLGESVAKTYERIRTPAMG